MGDLPFLIAMFDQVDVLLLIMVRVMAFITLMPVLSGMSIPMQVRLTVALVVSVAIFSSGLVTTVTYHDSVAGLFVLILTEFMAGMAMSFIVFFIFNILLFAGHFMDFSMGFAMVNVVDPIQQIQVPVIGNIMFLSMSALLIVNGGLNHLLMVFFDSYRIVPIGMAMILGNEPMAEYMVVSLVGFVILAIRIALPIVGTMLIIDVCLGIMVKAVPSMNVFVVGLPLKVLLGIFLLFNVVVPVFGFLYGLIFDNAFNSLVNIVEVMVYEFNGGPEVYEAYPAAP